MAEVRVVAPWVPAATLLAERARAHERLLGLLADGDAADALDGAADAIAGTLADGGTAYFFGNGGSAADAQHLVAELVGRFQTERAPLAAVALGTNPAVASALGNDYGFAAGIARELTALARAGDVAVGISTSGRSPNVLAALAVARREGLRTVALLGTGHTLDDAVDHAITVPTDHVPLVQEMHAVLGHLLCGLVEQRLGVA